MFPRLPTLPDINAVAHKATMTQLISIGGGAGGIFGGGGIGGGPTLTMPPITIGGSGGSGSSGGRTTTVGLGATIAGGLSSVLGIPAINWGRLAAFLLGILLIAGGIYLIPSVQRNVNVVVKQTGKHLAEATAEA